MDGYTLVKATGIQVDEHPERDVVPLIRANPALEDQPKKAVDEYFLERRRWRLVDEHPERDVVVPLIRANPALEAQPKNLEDKPQQASDGFVDIVEAEVRSAIPRRYYGVAPESDRWSTQPPTIYAVPSELADGNTRPYAPVAVAIGPIHHGALEPESMAARKLHNYKWCCVRALVAGRHAGPEGPQDPAAWTPADRRRLHVCLDTLKRLVPRIRASYDRVWDLDSDHESDQLVLMMLRDGCFVLHRLLKYAQIAKRAAQGNGCGGGGNGEEEDDDWTLVFGRCWVWGFVTCDLLLLENQIPFFVLQELFEHLNHCHPGERDDDDDVLVTGALRLFHSLHPRRMQSSRITCSGVHHLLHLFYLSISFPTPPPTAPGDLEPSTRRRLAVPPSDLPLWVPCARELDEAGVRFRARKDGAVSFLDVRFHGGVLEIPPLRLYDYSESMFRNLIAFEQTYPATPGHVTAYALFMDCLVTTPRDMRLLHQSGILVNQMSSGARDATRFFSRVSAQAHTAADLNYLAGVMEEVVRYQSSRWPRWRAALVRNYFSNPWVTTSLVAAVFLLAMTVLQTFFTAYAYFKPPKQT